MTESVVLTDLDLARARLIGRLRFVNATERRCDPGKGPASRCPDERYHVHGCCCEIGGGRIMSLPWDDNVGNFRRRDLGGILEVRSIRYWYRRIAINPTKRGGGKIPDDTPYLATVRLPGSRLVSVPGWIFMEDARRFPLESSPTFDTCHFVPLKALYRLADLRAWLARQRACESPNI